MFRAHLFNQKVNFILKPTTYILKGQKRYLQQVMTLLIEQALMSSFEGTLSVSFDVEHI